LRPDAPKYVARRPDLDKLLRGLLDALQGVLVRDDAQIVSIEACKRFASEGESPGVIVEIVKCNGEVSKDEG